MNISINDLRNFHKLASYVRGSNILPICSYVKMGGGKISKNAMTSFVEFDCESADADMLVEESLLSVKVGRTPSAFLNFSKGGNKVTITDSIMPTTFQVPPVSQFPSIPTPSSPRHPVSGNFMRVIEKAQNFPKEYDGKETSWMSFIMVGNGYVCASNGHGLFVEPVDEPFTIVLDNRHAQIISKLDVKEYAFSDNYMFFYGKGFVIGFSKQEIGYTDIIKYGQVNGTKMEFVGSASDFQRFNEECIHSSGEPWVTMSTGKMVMNDSKLDRRVEFPSESINVAEDFTYNAKTMIRLLTAVEGDEIEFYRGKDWYWIKSPNQRYTMLLMRLMDEN